MIISVVTTFHKPGLDQYAQRMIDTFCKNWPKQVQLYIYPESCDPIIPDQTQVISTDLDTVEDLSRFKQKWKNVPKANGDVRSDPVRSKRRDSGKGFKWDAVRFSNKVYAIFDCVKKSNADILLWMDADMVCHSPVSYETILRLCDPKYDLSYLGRNGKYSECGLYALNCKSAETQKFLAEFKRMYDDAEKGIFTLEEWHDSFVFDAVRKKFPNLKSQNWSQHLKDLRPHLGNSQGEGHPLINCEWGDYLDHLKGDRKSVGKSKLTDLKVAKKQDYWKNV
jgi:hypothetical protein